jgi:hypothetical protein
MKLIKPYLDDLVIGVECLFSWGCNPSSAAIVWGEMA